MDSTFSIRLYVKENKEVFEIIDPPSNRLISRTVQPLGTAFIEFIDKDIKQLMRETLENSYELLLKLRTIKGNRNSYNQLSDNEKATNHLNEKDFEVNAEITQLKSFSEKLQLEHVFFLPVCNDINSLLLDYFEADKRFGSYKVFTRYAALMVVIKGVIEKFLYYFADIDVKQKKTIQDRHKMFMRFMKDIESQFASSVNGDMLLDFLSINCPSEYAFFPEGKYNSTSFVNQELELAQVIYPKSFNDIVYFLMVKTLDNNVAFRECQNCGRYFLLDGNKNRKYCDRQIEGSTKTCKEYGAVKLYESEKKNDPISQLYSKAYRRQNSRIRYGKITRDEFNTWSKNARVMRDKCKNGEISLEDLTAWLNSDAGFYNRVY